MRMRVTICMLRVRQRAGHNDKRNDNDDHNNNFSIGINGNGSGSSTYNERNRDIAKQQRLTSKNWLIKSFDLMMLCIVINACCCRCRCRCRSSSIASVCCYFIDLYEQILRMSVASHTLRPLINRVFALRTTGC